MYVSVFVCYVCMYVFMYAYIYVFISVCRMYVFMYALMHVQWFADLHGLLMCLQNWLAANDEEV